ncbi:lipid-A-disaccharide synthase [Vespertiliibacter pulmonis]|uniref:Lipid-A-disaccharide synthase n=1 Tax=Vespertiliibacter pulmonis TaxID=1443036 RepID=A0A3N4VU41_9PAST|nr:lipid-A-disaccharide synthase [Vespertiliibacter pulmonis]QLB20552.1 lipid-A-disaccharide synthase [Vespertiliibacter pulmonis]RPE82681.1 lipid-A-disaccharide synthase [Vespertiliibacter pulmonis]
MTNSSPLIAIVAGEVSGDILGAGLINALKVRYPNARFIGVAGEKMLQAGCETLFDMEELSVMGLAEVVKHLPRLLKRRQQVINTMLMRKPDIFIGIDAPDFNLYVEEKLKSKGIKTIHYVSPSVWAWRQSRVHKIARAVDMVLAFLPFEKAFYDKFNVPCRFIGHTMADTIALKPSRQEACQLLGLDEAQRYVAILVGSRGSEVSFLSEPFLKTAQQLKAQFPDIQFLFPLVNEKRIAQFEAIKAQVAPELDVHILKGNARSAMIVADATLLASGTAALEAMLCKSPMVVGYKMKPTTYWLAKKLVKTDYISLPNLLANAPLVPELIQDECNPENLANHLARYLSTAPDDLKQKNVLKQRFIELHQQIQSNADYQAAQAVADVLSENGSEGVE